MTATSWYEDHLFEPEEPDKIKVTYSATFNTSGAIVHIEARTIDPDKTIVVSHQSFGKNHTGMAMGVAELWDVLTHIGPQVGMELGPLPMDLSQEPF